METKQIKPAKLCFEHIGGKLGELLLDAFLSKGWIAKQTLAGKHFYITDRGESEFSKLGIDLNQIKAETPA